MDIPDTFLAVGRTAHRSLRYRLNEMLSAIQDYELHPMEPLKDLHIRGVILHLVLLPTLSQLGHLALGVDGV